MAGQGRMRWYNPGLGGFEWRRIPESDQEALCLLDGCQSSELCVRVYREWRELGASIVASLIRAGEAAKEEQDPE
ncbi:MAG: hypothetical protein H0X71_10010 [Rubrobacter sp.]|nr:hypothetical protein [Rubrobacter sp.]